MTDNAQKAEELRQEFRSWLASNYTTDVKEAIGEIGSAAGFEAHREWNATLVDAGWGAISWPAEFGGREATLEEQLAYNEELSRVGARGPINQIGVSNIAPAIMAVGTEEQKNRFIHPMHRGDEIWSQGMSEPEVGSDLASLQCRAVLDGDHLVINGQKTWNSNGTRADWCQLYVRTGTEGSKYEGITCLLLDMRTPGIEARPIVTMTGDEGFSELFFTDVRVPVESVLGEIDKGWSVAVNTLSNERSGVAIMYLTVERTFADLLEAASAPGPDGCRPIDSQTTRQRLMSIYADVRNLEFLAKRSIAVAISGRPPGPEGSVIKLAWSETSQRMAEAAVDVLGMGSLEGRWGREFISSRSYTIAGGTSEVNRNILGERVLGLPREPKVAV
ncbi:acyl-CoA dehydrogenase family protein [Candidatus Poriferisocius sp.]|uniref:acyl-CoA dehydrogenase family protein n=1 Tax=Candidatus Poriferisocius sp. TaxID=3101276 RepID=UPI003B01F348